MTIRSIRRYLAPVIAIQAAAGCSRFVWHEDPFTPDPAPTSEIIAVGSDTTYVRRRPSYYLLTPQRNALWNRDVLDDVVWRYHALFGEAPPTIAIRLDTVAVVRDSTTWRGMPLARVAPPRRPDRAKGKEDGKRDDARQASEDSARARMLAGPILAATAAEAWLGARALDAARVTDSQPGGPVRTTTSAAALPAWLEAGALRILGASGAPDRAARELRADERAIIPLTSLFAVRWQTRPNVMDVVGAGGAGLFMADDDRPVTFEPDARTRSRRDIARGASPMFLAQSVSVLTFIHERDPAVVARLADALPRGDGVESVLAGSATLPHDVAGLDAAWRQWLKRSVKRRR